MNEFENIKTTEVYLNDPARGDIIIKFTSDLLGQIAAPGDKLLAVKCMLENVITNIQFLTGKTNIFKVDRSIKITVPDDSVYLLTIEDIDMIGKDYKMLLNRNRSISLITTQCKIVAVRINLFNVIRSDINVIEEIANDILKDLKKLDQIWDSANNGTKKYMNQYIRVGRICRDIK